jgi:hypothetical protein
MSEQATRKPSGFGVGLIIAVVVSGIVFGSFFVHHQVQVTLVTQLYDELAAKTSEVLESVEVGTMSSTEGCFKLLHSWTLIEGDEIYAEVAGIALPGILKWTGTTRFPNSPEQRARMIGDLKDALRTMSGVDQGEELAGWLIWLSRAHPPLGDS